MNLAEELRSGKCITMILGQGWEKTSIKDNGTWRPVTEDEYEGYLYARDASLAREKEKQSKCPHDGDIIKPAWPHMFQYCSKCWAVLH